MKKKDLQDLHLKTRDELIKSAMDLEKEILSLKLTMAGGKVKNINEARRKMKERAVVLTLAQEKGAKNV